MSRRRLPLPLIALLVGTACGAGDLHAPPYADPGPACPKAEAHLPRLLAALEQGGAQRLKASMEVALDEELSGRLVEVIAAAGRALPTEPFAGILPEEALREGADAVSDDLAAAIRGVAASPDLTLVAQKVRPVLSECNLGPVLTGAAAVLRDPSFPAFAEALTASAMDRDAVAALRQALLSTSAQREGWPHLAVPLVCLLRNTEDDLGAYRQFLVPLLGERAKVPPLSDAVEGLLNLMAPGTEARAALADWIGCYVGKPPGPDPYSCPYPLPAGAPDPDATLVRITWDVLASTASVEPTETPAPDPRLLALTADLLEALGAEEHLASAWADIAHALLNAPAVAQALTDLADLIEAGALAEVASALSALSAGCER